MSLAAKIARNTLIHALGRAISCVIALVVVAIMTRALGPEGFGGYSTVIAFLQFFGITVDFGLTLTANRLLGAVSGASPGHSERSEESRANARPASAGDSSASPQNDESSKLMSNLMTLRFVSAIIFLGLAPCVALFFPYPTIVKQAMFLTTLSFLAIIMGQTMVPVFQKELKMGYVAISEIAGRVVLLAGVALAAYLRLNLIWFMTAIVLGSAVQYLFLRVYATAYLALKWAWDRAIMRKIIITSWPIGVSIIFNLIYLKADTIILSVMRPQAEVGFYGASYRVLDQFTALATMFINLALPPMTAAWVAGNRKYFRKLYQGAFDAYAIIAFPLMIGALITGQRLMAFVAGSDFAVSGSILGIHMIAMFGVFFSTLFGHIIVVINKQKPMIWGYVSTAIIALIIYPLTIARYGMFGAAWATVATEFIIMVLTFLMVWRATHLAPRFMTFWKSLLAALIMGTFLTLAHGTPLAILIICGMFIYILVFFALGGIKKEILREIITSKP